MPIMRWFDGPHFGTRDLDALGFGDPGAAPAKARVNIFRRLCRFSHQPIVLVMMCWHRGRGFSTSSGNRRSYCHG
ncbi:hypothetical protein [Rhizobium leguminosarum]|uniref:hypothetical protein n=1 Tax=Rhizobium leguminosarum TaxID=384 RepID=UPI0019D4830F|nr:hypothetical protein [Rhizobium leguminosarum]